MVIQINFLKSIPYIFLILLMISCDSEPTKIISEIPDNSQKISLKKENSTRDLQLFAKALSIFLRDENNQKYFEEKIKKSNYVENILEATEFLNSEIFIKNGDKTNLTLLKNELSTKLDYQNKSSLNDFFNKLKFGEIDIYFPIRGHRDRWKAGDELFITSFNGDKKDKTPVVAYDLKGNEIFLSKEKAPSIPTVVIYPSEKQKKYQNKIVESAIAFKKQASALPVVEPTGSNWYSCTWTGVCIKQDYEGWLMGSMEIFLKFRYRYNSSFAWSGWRTDTYDFTSYESQFIEKESVDAGEWKRDINIQILKLPQNFDIQVQIWELDWTFDDSDLVADEYYSDAYGCNVNYPTSILRCDYLCTDIRFVDGFYPSDDFDLLDLHWNRRYAE